jgi:hypothetical protein
MIAGLWLAIAALVAWDFIRTRAVRKAFANATRLVEEHLAKLKEKDAARIRFEEETQYLANIERESAQAARDKFRALLDHLGIQNIEYREVEKETPMRVVSREWVVVPDAASRVSGASDA